MITNSFGKQLNFSYQVKVHNAHKYALFTRIMWHLITKVYQKNFFDTAVKNLDVKGPQVSHINKDSDPIVITLNKYVGYPSIFKRKEYFNKPTGCNFLEVIPNYI